MSATGVTGFASFWQTYILVYFAPILQMSLWIVEIVVFIKVLSLYKRYVDHKTRAKNETVAPVSDIKVDAFVE